MCVCAYIYMILCVSLSIYMYIYIYMYIFMYIYIYRERQRERDLAASKRTSVCRSARSSRSDLPTDQQSRSEWVRSRRRERVETVYLGLCADCKQALRASWLMSLCIRLPAYSIWGFDNNFTNYTFKTNMNFKHKPRLPPLWQYHNSMC